LLGPREYHPDSPEDDTRFERPDRRAYIRSDLTNREVSLEFFLGGQQVPFESTTGIPPEAEFIIGAVLPSVVPQKSQGISADAFLVEFGRFTFVFDYGADKQVVRHFSKEEVEMIVEQADRDTRKQLGYGKPRVIHKKL
jgi:hypothetical protein